MITAEYYIQINILFANLDITIQVNKEQSCIIFIFIWLYIIIFINYIVFPIIWKGQSDETICFCCNQGLKEWEHNDDPWVEHARWSPTCSFVLLSKGKNFVEEVGGEVNNNLDVDMEVSIFLINLMVLLISYVVITLQELCRLITVKTNYTVYDSSLSNLLPRYVIFYKLITGTGIARYIGRANKDI